MRVDTTGAVAAVLGIALRHQGPWVELFARAPLPQRQPWARPRARRARATRREGTEGRDALCPASRREARAPRRCPAAKSVKMAGAHRVRLLCRRHSALSVSGCAARLRAGGVINTGSLAHVGGGSAAAAPPSRASTAYHGGADGGAALQLLSCCKRVSSAREGGSDSCTSTVNAHRGLR